MDIKLLKITDEVFSEYTYKIVDSKYDSRDLVERKLTRNRLLSASMGKTRDEKGMIYSYGSLRFMVKNDIVEWLACNQPVLPMWYKDREKYNELNIELGISEIKKEESDATVEVGRVIQRKKKRFKNARSQLFYLKNRVLKSIGDNEDSKWIIDHIDTIYDILENEDEEDTIWNS